MCYSRIRNWDEQEKEMSKKREEKDTEFGQLDDAEFNDDEDFGPDDDQGF
jgi:hypothetical protein